MNKIILQFPAPFWETAQNRDNGIMTVTSICTMTPYFWFISLSKELMASSDYNPITSSSPHILMCFLSSSFALEREHMSDEQLQAEVMDVLRSIYVKNYQPQQKYTISIDDYRSHEYHQCSAAPTLQLPSTSIPVHNEISDKNNE